MTEEKYVRKRLETENYQVSQVVSTFKYEDPSFDKIAFNVAYGFVPILRTLRTSSEVIIRHKLSGIERVIVNTNNRSGISVDQLGREGFQYEDLGGVGLSLIQLDEQSGKAVVRYQVITSVPSYIQPYGEKHERTGVEKTIECSFKDEEISCEEIQERELTAFEVYGP